MLPPMIASEYQANIVLHKAVLHTTSVGYELRKTLNESRKNVEHSRRLIEETGVILDQSRLLILASQRLTLKG